VIRKKERFVGTECVVKYEGVEMAFERGDIISFIIVVA